MRWIVILVVVPIYVLNLAVVSLGNEPPYFIGCQDYLMVGTGNRLIHDFIAIDPDGDPLIYGLECQSICPNFDATTGRIDYRTFPMDIGLHELTVSVSDGNDTALCTFHINVVSCGDINLCLEGASCSNTPKALPGNQVTIGILLAYTDEVLDGFNFLVGYDTEYLTFIDAAMGDELVACEWEYFEYADESDNKNGNPYSQGLARVIAVADTGLGDQHPDPYCFYEWFDADAVATLTFQLADDPDIQGTHIPVSFFWTNCTDNIVLCNNPTYGFDKGREGCVTVFGTDSTYICDYIYDVDGTMLTDRDFGFPGGFGPPDACFVYGSPLPIPLIRLTNGCIYVACPGGGDANGDEIVNVADAVFLINYVFKEGPAPDPLDEGDANCDAGVNVADAVYLINYIFKDGPGPCIECP